MTLETPFWYFELWDNNLASPRSGAFTTLNPHVQQSLSSASAESSGKVVESIVTFPNPTANFVTIDFGSIVRFKKNKSITIELFSAEGKLLEQWDVLDDSSFRLNLTEHADGLYFVSIKIGHSQYFSQICKNS